MEFVFTTTDEHISTLVSIDEARRELRPNAEVHLTESGLFCNEEPGKCNGGNDYPCWYRSFDNLFWIASAGQWLYQYLTFSKAANITSIAQSQILGYPYQYDGLSGEWASGSMVDFTGEPGLNAKYYVELLLLQNVARPFQFVATSAPPDGVYVQGITSSKGNVLVVINKLSRTMSVNLPGTTGKRSFWIEEDNWKSPPTEKPTPSGLVALSPFAVVLIRM